MKKTFPLLVVTLLVCAVQVAAQKPGAEQKRIGYFAGTWKLVATMQDTPISKSGRLTITENNSWVAGGFHLISHAAHQAPLGDTYGSRRQTHAIRSYDSDSSMYTYDAFLPLGRVEHCKGSVTGNTWTFTCSFTSSGGQGVETRYTARELTPSGSSSNVATSARTRMDVPS